MKFGTAYLALICLVASNSNTSSNNNNEVAAFSTPLLARRPSSTLLSSSSFHRSTMTSSTTSSPSLIVLSMAEGGLTEQDDEIARLKAMAQKLRSEAALLESNQAKDRADVAKLAFEKFDLNQDGDISVEELKAGLEKQLKMEVSADRVQQLMQEFDVNQDGFMQVEEMVSVEQFRNKLEAYAREEKQVARQALSEAQEEVDKAKLAEARLEFLNDKDPTQQDKVLSVLPYLFPLLDSLQFGRFLLVDNAENPIVGLVGLLYATYTSIPFSGFIAYVALNTLSSNPGLNRLIRFNMQQAIFLDIALFVPGLLIALVAGVGSVAGFTIPDATNQFFSTAIFGVLVVTILYSSISSLLGQAPNKIPVISQAVEDRMPTYDMFDEEGRFVPRQARENKDKEEKDNKKDNDNNNDNKKE